MKKFIQYLIIAVALPMSAVAQLSEGHLSYKLNFTSSDPQMSQMTGMLDGSTMDVYFKGQAARSEMKMGTIMTVTTIATEANDNILMLMDGMVGKKAILQSMEEMNEQEEEQPDYEVEITDETKKILDYTCQKAIFTDEEGNEMTMWFTKDIVINKKGQRYMSEKIEGVPLEFEMKQNGMTMKFTATQVEDKLTAKNDYFNQEVPAGYELMDKEALKKMGM